MILGNLLKEKKSNLPVIIVEEDELQKFKIHLEDTIPIPFSSLGNENGVLFGFQPEIVKVSTAEEQIHKKAFIGIYQGNLCEGKKEYHAIIGL